MNALSPTHRMRAHSRENPPSHSARSYANQQRLPAVVEPQVEQTDGKERQRHYWFRIKNSAQSIKVIVLVVCAISILSSARFPMRRSLREVAHSQQRASAGRVPRTSSLSSSSSSTFEANNEGNGRPPSDIKANSLWDDSVTIPPWMKRYFAWHQSERGKLTRENWRTKRYLVQRCLPSDDECGGACDRLGPLPYLLMLANRTNRLLFLHWSRPGALEEFLVPPVGGMNWTIPEVVNFTLTHTNETFQQLANNTASPIIGDPGNVNMASTDRVVVEARFRGLSSLASVLGRPPNSEYDAGRDSPTEATFEEVYSDMWRVLFEPSPPVMALIDSNLEQLGLKTRKYVSAHVRSLYSRDNTGRNGIVRNALHCAASLKPDEPVYLAGDSADVTRFGMNYGRRSLNRTVVAVSRDDPLLHLDLGQNFLSWKSREDIDWSQYPPSAYYDTFVDLFLLSYGSCMAFGRGSYGRWARMISRDSDCSIDHSLEQCSGP